MLEQPVPWHSLTLALGATDAVRVESQSQMAEARIPEAEAQMSQLPVWTPARALRGNKLSLSQTTQHTEVGTLAHKVTTQNFGSLRDKSDLVLKVISPIFGSQSDNSKRSWW